MIKKQSTMAPEPAITSTARSVKDNTSIIVTKAAVEKEKAPGFELVFGLVSLLGFFLKSRGR